MFDTVRTALLTILKSYFLWRPRLAHYYIQSFQSTHNHSACHTDADVLARVTAAGRDLQVTHVIVNLREISHNVDAGGPEVACLIP
jgi:hypothetical protein